MKRVVLILIGIIVIGGTTACNNQGGQNAIAQPVYPTSVDFDDYDTRREIINNNPVEDTFKDSVQNFTYTTASKILIGTSENINYSPISLYMALALAGTGANGETEKEIYTLLNLEGKDREYLCTQMGDLFRTLYSDNEIGKLKIANSIWLSNELAYHDAFTAKAVEHFYSSIFHVDFENSSTASEMSDWISENTNGVLTPKISVNKEQMISIINTIYFKDEWINRFNENSTEKDTFYLSNGEQVQCDFMNKTYTVHGATKGEGFTSSSLSLKNFGSMIFILPDQGVSVDDLLASSEKTASLFDTTNSLAGKVIFKIPKFSFGNDINLKPLLKELGILSAFESTADFTGITDDMAYISAIKQQTHIAIDEKGVEAAAYTQIDYAGSALPTDDIVEMILDRPFIYGITAKDGTLLFIGVCNNPNQQ